MGENWPEQSHSLEKRKEFERGNEAMRGRR